MNSKTKRRMAAVTGLILIVLIVVLAVVGGSSAAKSITVAQATDGSMASAKVKVTGKVVPNSFSEQGNVLTFFIYDSDADPNAQTQLQVNYDGGASATFGNDVEAICTGKIDDSGVLQCSELVTKCPSKYENATNALSVSDLLNYGSEVYDRPVKVAGTVVAGSLASASSDARFVLQDAETADTMPVAFDGGLSDDIADGSSLVVTGSLGEAGTFTATDVALEG